MIPVLDVADQFIALVRITALFAAVVFAIICLVDWAVRTRKINPFNPIARFFRETIDPFIAPVERRVVRAGHMPHTAPLWALGAVIIGGFILVGLLNFLRREIVMVAMMAQEGPRGILRLLVSWTFELLRAALLVRVISSWFQMNPYSPWVRWSYVLSEPILRPLRGFIPPLGMIDLTPLIAYFLLGFVQGFIMRLV